MKEEYISNREKIKNKYDVYDSILRQNAEILKDLICVGALEGTDILKALKEFEETRGGVDAHISFIPDDI